MWDIGVSKQAHHPLLRYSLIVSQEGQRKPRVAWGRLTLGFAHRWDFLSRPPPPFPLEWLCPSRLRKVWLWTLGTGCPVMNLYQFYWLEKEGGEMGFANPGSTTFMETAVGSNRKCVFSIDLLLHTTKSQYSSQQCRNRPSPKPSETQRIKKVTQMQHLHFPLPHH